MSGPRCTEAEAHIVDEIDARLDPAATLRLHAHLETCASCRQRADLWGWLVPEMRDLEPAPIDALAARRMQVEIERRLVAETPAAPARRRMSPALPAALALLGAAAAIAIWAARPARTGSTAGASYASVARVRGGLTAAGAALARAAAVPIGTPLAVAAGAEAELALPRGTTLTIEGPARVALAGPANAIHVRLDEGEVIASVAHRLPGETFAVITRDLRVAVKGTRFAVTAAPTGSRVSVDEGTVIVTFADGHARPVSAGQSASSIESAEGAEPAEDTTPEEPAGELAPRPSVRADSCPAAAQSCPDTAEAVRSSMRAGEMSRALQILSERGRALVDLDPRCGGRAFAACQDDLRYLRAEALNQSGRLDDAVAAYRALDRRGAPPAMRQNALVAAAQIERRRGHNLAARADYERAITAAPRGALREEAFIGAMEAADSAGDHRRAQGLARRYLIEFPKGLATATASRLAGGGTQP